MRKFASDCVCVCVSYKFVSILRFISLVDSQANQKDGQTGVPKGIIQQLASRITVEMIMQAAAKSVNILL